MIHSRLGFLGFVALMGVANIGCAGPMSEWRTANCNYNGAYQIGVNDARTGRPMDAARLNPSCEDINAPDVQRGYREGYETGMKVPQVQAGPSSEATVVIPQTCLESLGKKVCGYNCVKGLTDVQCAIKPEHNCVEAAGQIRCGMNCKADTGQITCDADK